MTALHEALAQYVTVRRALGTRLSEPANTLRQFVTFLEQEGSSHITTALALRWAAAPPDVQRATWGRRLSMVRKFAAWLSAFDPQTEVPPRRLLPSRHRRPRPHIYTEAETRRLMAAAARRPSRTDLRPLTYTTLIGLLAATGLRPGEALALDRADVDLQNGILFIRETKFGKSRFVPVAATTRRALQQYAARRDTLCPCPRAPAFFLSERGLRLVGATVRAMFVRLSRSVGLRPANGSPRAGRGPRLQDFRHNSETRIIPSAPSNDVALPEMPIWADSTHARNYQRPFRKSITLSLGRYRGIETFLAVVVASARSFSCMSACR